jgi:transcriptional regulator with XRE-family HTH domain
MTTAYVYDFTEGSRAQADLLGGKGANPAETTRLGLPVPPGFTVGTDACRAFLRTGSAPDGLDGEIAAHPTRLERVTGRRLDRADDPLLVSVRSGARLSMPGMMDTILDVGRNDASVIGLARATGRERFAWDSYRRLVQMYGATVLGIDADRFEDVPTRRRRQVAAADDLGPDTRQLAETVREYQAIIHDATGEGFPQDPHEQLRRAVVAVFASWNGERAAVHRRREDIPDDLGTAVNIQAMVFGDLGPDSGSGVAFTRDPGTGRPGVHGDYLPDAQVEDVVSGVRDALALDELRRLDPDSYGQLVRTGIATGAAPANPIAHRRLRRTRRRPRLDPLLPRQRRRLRLLLALPPPRCSPGGRPSHDRGARNTSERVRAHVIELGPSNTRDRSRRQSGPVYEEDPMDNETAGTRFPDMIDIPRNIRTRREQLGLTRADVCARAGLPLKWLVELEAGDAPLSRAALGGLAVALETTVTALVSGAVSTAREKPNDPDGRSLIPMSETECYARLAAHEVGRLAGGMGQAPWVLPVNYVPDGKDIAFTTRPGSPLADVQGTVAFEVDDVDRYARLGWSVLVIGVAEPVTDPEEIARLTEAGSGTWPTHRNELWFRIRPGRVTGRRLRPRMGRR